MERETQKTNESLIIGRNAVAEAVKSGRAIDTLLVAKGERGGSVGSIIASCRDKGVVIKEVDRKKLDFICSGSVHQGVAAYAAAHDYSSIDDIFALAEQRGEAPFIIICDELEDPHNLGAVIRSAEAGGAHGIIIPKRRACGVNSTVSKVSAGAVQHMKIARVNNINETIKFLKQNDIWICGTDGQAKTYYYQQDFKMPVAIIIGSEGYGMSRLVKENCDFLVKIPMKGKITSLNASVSAGIVMYEVTKQREN